VKKIVVDTNLLVRLVVDDDPGRLRAAARIVKEAEAVIVGNLVLSELVWVLWSRYRFSSEEIGQAIGNLCRVSNVVVDRLAVEAGLRAMQGGADFADGVIAYEGLMAGGEEFVSFDKTAVAALAKQGVKARQLK
jgi:predicted nucleic-acid-binding protein